MGRRIKPGREQTNGAKALRHARERTQMSVQSDSAPVTTGHYNKTLMPFSGPVPSSRTCQFTMWPYGVGWEHPDFGKFCGKKTFKRSYCEDHYRLCWNADFVPRRLQVPSYRKDT